MGKGSKSKAKKKQRKLEGLELKETPKRQPDGRKRPGGIYDPRRTALDARCRKMGIEPNRETRRSVGAPHMGLQIGMALEVTFDREEVDRLWSILKNWMRADWIYKSRVLGQRDFAKTASIQMMHERFEADLSSAPDLRSDDEKHRDAVNMWMAWQGCLGHLSASQRRILDDIKHDREGMWQGEEITERGETAVRVLQMFADIVEDRLT